MLSAVTFIDQITRALTTGPSTVVIEPPGSGDGYWAGGPSVVYDEGVFYLAYRLRRPVDRGRGYANVVARSTDGIVFETVSTVLASGFACASLERPALIRRPDGGWRLYVSCSTPGSKHWWVEALDTVGTCGTGDTAGPEGLSSGKRTVVLPGDADTAWKDVVVTRDDQAWRMWACRHLLDRGEDEADRMQAWFASSADGLDWSVERPALLPTVNSWDQRGVRVTSAWEWHGKWLATYDGRASAAENWHERTGVALGASPDDFVAVGGPIERNGRTLRYVAVAQLPDGLRLYYEAERADGANDLRTAFVPFE